MSGDVVSLLQYRAKESAQHGDELALAEYMKNFLEMERQNKVSKINGETEKSPIAIYRQFFPLQ